MDGLDKTERGYEHSNPMAKTDVGLSARRSTYMCFGYAKNGFLATHLYSLVILRDRTL